MKKITTGFVIQDYDENTGKCLSQAFVAGDEVDWEDEYGDFIDPPKNEEYFPFDMVQPVINDPDVITGRLVSDWGDVCLRIEATLNLNTGQIITKECPIDVDGLDSLEEEYFLPDKQYISETSLDEPIPVCMDCHEFIMKSVMTDMDGTNLEETMVCMNEDCESNQ